MTKLEIERRWLVKLPLSEAAWKVIEGDLDVPAKIVQHYLKSDDNTVKRVRFVEYEVWDVKFPPHYLSTTKKLIEMGVNQEEEHQLTEAEYVEKLYLETDHDHLPIEKTRYHLHHGSKLWELDLFGGAHEGLAILELELSEADREAKIEPPPYLDILREITKEQGWSNFDLSFRSFDKDMHIDPSNRDGLGWFSRLMNWFRPQMDKPIEHHEPVEETTNEQA